MVWTLFEYPETSKAGFVVALLSVTITLISIVLFCVETLPAYATSHCVKDEAPNFADPFFIIESVCTAWFPLQSSNPHNSSTFSSTDCFCGVQRRQEKMSESCFKALF